MKIYCFCNTKPNDAEWYVMLAMAEDGYVLASHVCSHPSYGPHDMGITSNWKHEAYQAHCPNGYDLEWVDGSPLDHEGLNAAFAKNQALAAEEQPAREAHARVDVEVGP
jgi:hypothetical protein